MTATPTAPLATEGAAWVSGYRDRAPEAMKKAVTATGMNLSTAAADYARELRRIAAEALATAEAVERGEWIGPMSNTLRAGDLARTAATGAQYEALATTWHTLVDGLPAA
ncbi:hypothetical protein [Parafrankia sp. FMc2]|uniref:hypothetical protein n=1 Tax=Parafrankia sp. FMc2 TaxID=3233196 RepID=UPI0034D69B36